MIYNQKSIKFVRTYERVTTLQDTLDSKIPRFNMLKPVQGPIQKQSPVEETKNGNKFIGLPYIRRYDKQIRQC